MRARSFLPVIRHQTDRAYSTGFRRKASACTALRNAKTLRQGSRVFFLMSDTQSRYSTSFKKQAFYPLRNSPFPSGFEIVRRRFVDGRYRSDLLSGFAFVIETSKPRPFR